MLKKLPNCRSKTDNLPMDKLRALKEKDADFGVNMMGFSINPDCF